MRIDMFHFLLFFCRRIFYRELLGIVRNEMMLAVFSA